MVRIFILAILAFALCSCADSYEISGLHLKPAADGATIAPVTFLGQEIHHSASCLASTQLAHEVRKLPTRSTKSASRKHQHRNHRNGGCAPVPKGGFVYFNSKDGPVVLELPAAAGAGLITVKQTLAHPRETLNPPSFTPRMPSYSPRPLLLIQGKPASFKTVLHVAWLP
jgi:hypothetical protein